MTPTMPLTMKRLHNSGSQTNNGNKTCKDSNPSSALVKALLSEMRYEQMKTHQNNERKLMIEAINQSNVNETILTQLNQITDQIQMKTTGHSAGQNTY